VLVETLNPAQSMPDLANYCLEVISAKNSTKKFYVSMVSIVLQDKGFHSM